MNLVLANGSLVTVSGDSDLFWALRGAGHNFGIVTSVTSTIYDIQHPNYAMETIIFSGDQVEDVYALANELWLTNGSSMPEDLNNWSYWYLDPTADAEKVSPPHRDLIDKPNLVLLLMSSPSSRCISSKKA